ncbi:pyocin knob domain-containing S74 family peptidase, partial [Microbulbifer sp. TYP-18]|uniref:pyocin knob domain-containing S74 family peptidase n=1 Tax=Microbulbifer sp. TYP-18 TaxID=3230024 RepID=UPI0034C6C1D6
SLAASESENNANASAGQATTSAQNAANSAVTATTQADLATTAKTDAQAARDGAINAKAGAETAQGIAGSSAVAAADSAIAAQSAQTGAETAEVKAFQWANHPEDQLLPGETQYSGAHWAAKAAESAASASGQVEFLGSWDAAINGTPPTPANSARYVIISDGVVDGKNVYVNDFITYSVPDAAWFVTPGSGNVASVNGYIGAVVLDYGDFAGAQNTLFDAGVGVRGKNSAGAAKYLARTSADGAQVWLGDATMPAVVQSASVPRWNNGSASVDLLHTGSGNQWLAGRLAVGKSQTPALANGGNESLVADTGLYAHANVDGGETFIGFASGDSFDARFYCNPAQKVVDFVGGNAGWKLQQAGQDLLHSGGGQTVSGTTTFDRVRFPGASAEPIEFLHPTAGSFKVGFQDDYLRFRGSGADNPAGIRLDDESEAVVALSRHGASQFYRGLNASAISEDGTTLAEKYLGISATAADSAKLGGEEAAHFISGKNASGTLGVEGTNGWNDVVKSGFYNGSVQANDPLGNATGWYWGIHVSHENTSQQYGWTLVSSNSANPTWYLRGVQAGTWGNWYQVITSKGGQTIHGGLELGAAITLPFGDGFQSKDSGGTPHSIARLGTGNLAILGTAIYPTRIDSAVVPRWWDGTYNRDLLHSGGGQSIGGLTTFNSASYGQHIKIVRGGESWSITSSLDGSLDFNRNSGSGTAKVDMPALNASGALTQSGHQVWHDGNTSGFTPASAPALGVVNLNNYQTPGFYYQTANANATSGSNYPTAKAGSLVVQAAAGVTQQYYTYNFLSSDAPDFYFRGYYNSSWSAWRKVLHSGSTNASVAGSLGIGVAPGSTLANGKGIALGDSDTGIRQNGDGVLELWANNQEVMQLTSSTIYSYKRHYFNAEFTVNDSDAGLKEHFREVELTRLLEKLVRIEWLLYDLKDGSAKDQFGVVAQSIQKILPEVVERNPVTGDLSVCYPMIYNYWCAVNAWQAQRLTKQQRRLRNQQKALNRLTARVKELEAA